MKKYILLLCSICAVVTFLAAQTTDSVKVKHKKFVNNGRMYGSWGYNEEWYTHSNISIMQPGQQNNFTYENIQAHDHIGWNNLFNVAPTIPQYNYRLGYFFDEKQNWAIELNFDHTKYVVTQGYNAIIKGEFRGKTVDSAININGNTLFWQLNNGANWFLLNIVRRFNVVKTKDNKLVVYALLKVGFGPCVPHVDNSIFTEQNHRHFQVGGVNTGVEALLRFTLFDHVYVEYCNKVDYADYWGLRIFDGTAGQAFAAYEMILNFGLTCHKKKTAGTYTAR
jgi:hypothetical protein